jgi:hypothetical protein
MSKNLYRELCVHEDSIPVFLRDWWLDCACGENWDVLLSVKNGEVIAAMPLYLPVGNVVSMPHYTQVMGVWFARESADTKYSSILEHRQAVCKQFIEKLRKYKSFLQNFDYDFTDWLPFYWEGFKQTTRYSYILDNLKSRDIILENMSQQIRRNLKKSEKAQITVRRGVPIEDFIKIQTLTFERQNKKNKQSSAVLSRLVETAQNREQGDIFGGYDSDGNLHAVAFVVWQKSSAYYIAGGGNPVFRSSGAHSLVLWEAIKHVSQYTDTFDFEGSMIPGVERFFREFGALQKPYFTISKGKLSFGDRVRIKINSLR